ncbi:MAG: hypothetical protein BWY06_02634 [Candidatus Latescibacteria bacterium ADurb.Bin168]|nr:MAG: hypothetical protein BWY06_02634 [Candidatus Latescibacteria bacterium ADurb.Bin168]
MHLFVDLAGGRIEITVQGLVDAFRQIEGIGFRHPVSDRMRFLDQIIQILVAIDDPDPPSPNHDLLDLRIPVLEDIVTVSKDVPVQEPVLGPDIERVLRHRGAGQDQLVPDHVTKPVQKLRSFRFPVLDPLRLIQDHHIGVPRPDLVDKAAGLIDLDDFPLTVFSLHLARRDRVVVDGADVQGIDPGGVRELSFSFFVGLAVDHDDVDRGVKKLFQFFLPVVDDREWGDHKDPVDLSGQVSIPDCRDRRQRFARPLFHQERRRIERRRDRERPALVVKRSRVSDREFNVTDIDRLDVRDQIALSPFFFQIEEEFAEPLFGRLVQHDLTLVAVFLNHLFEGNGGLLVIGILPDILLRVPMAARHAFRNRPPLLLRRQGEDPFFPIVSEHAIGFRQVLLHLFIPEVLRIDVPVHQELSPIPLHDRVREPLLFRRPQFEREQGFCRWLIVVRELVVVVQDL